MQWGAAEDRLRALQRDGMAVPALARRPALFEDLWPVWEAYDLLRSGRQASMALLPFAASDITAIVDLCGVRDVGRRMSWFRCLRAMDAVELDCLRARVVPRKGRATDE